MNKVAVALGILVLILGVILAILDASGVIIYVTLNNPFPRVWELLIEAVVAIAFMVAGGILIFWGIKKR